jgi:hypothetical protein
MKWLLLYLGVLSVTLTFAIALCHAARAAERRSGKAGKRAGREGQRTAMPGEQGSPLRRGAANAEHTEGGF